MARPFLPVLGCLSIAALSMLAGCPAKGDGEASASASPAPSISVARTCKDAAGRYGEFFATSLMEDPKNPVPPALHEKAKAGIKEAVVRSCEEDKWDQLPLDCLGGAFEQPTKLGVPLEDVLTVCADSAGNEKSDKMTERVARAMANAVRDPAPTADASAPVPSASASPAPIASEGATAQPAKPQPVAAQPGGPRPTAKPAPPPKPAAPPKRPGEDQF